MKLENQVVSLELAKKMKELGFKQDSYFKWVGKDIWDETAQSELEIPSTPSRDKWFSAYTSSELGEMLPVEISKEQSKHQYKLEIVKEDERGKWYIRYRNTIDSFMNLGFMADTEADARAKMLIYLKENKLI